MDKPSPIYLPAEHFERLHVQPREGRTLIVGSFVTEGKQDRRALYADVLGVDMRAGPGVDLVANLEDALPEIGDFDHVECLSVLEHSCRPWLLAANIERLMKPRGTLHLSVPFIWGLHSYPDDCYRFTASGIRHLFPGIEWSALLYATDRLHNKGKTGRKIIDGHVWVPRTEVHGFGVKR